MTIPDAAKKVPMMYRAQINGRSQLHTVASDNNKQSDATRWVQEWTAESYPKAPELSANISTKVYSLTWRFVTNGGQDDGIIRPVIGTRGWPFYPGSSMKGLFRKACTPEQANKYCGSEDEKKPQGILRFHGGYPTSSDWTQKLVDIIHPQQDKQVKEDRKPIISAQISLYQPELQFGISSLKSDEETDWETVWEIWERAIASGLGCRVSAGYGQPKATNREQELYRVGLKGQGQAAKLIDEDSGEFRPNIFRASIRGHTLRIFGGLTTAENAERLVEQLFGGVQGKPTVGLLSMAFETRSLVIERYGKQPTYEVTGTLRWLLTKEPISPNEKEALALLIRLLMRFAMLLGGFGNSWRRADHRLFYPDYNKHLIGCHWEWFGTRAILRENRVSHLSHVSTLLESVQKAAKDWMAIKGTSITPNKQADWREAWHPNNVQVWGRLAADDQDSEAIAWLHGPYQRRDRSLNRSEQTIKQTTVTGSLGKIGRLWHRMYPWVNVTPNPDSPKRPNIIHTQKYFELLTLFPDNTREFQKFQNYLEDHQDEFELLWPNN